METLEFQAEARQLLQLVVNSIYSNKDIFLRELISNAADALDRMRLEPMVDKELDVDVSDLHITVAADRDARTLTIRDNGIGMTRDEVVRVIGTIAKSGTAEFVSALRQADDPVAALDLIGQFGIGFYSSFMVADSVMLQTRRAGESAGTRWVSDGGGTYTIDVIDDAPQGTTVVLHLKSEDGEDQLPDYTQDWRVRDLIKRYSDFVSWPIRMPSSRQPDDGISGDEEDDIFADPTNKHAEDAAREAWETVNCMKALWTRSRDEVSPAEYGEFYQHVSHDWCDPLEIIHTHGEGNLDYHALLFIPARAPFDLYSRDRRTEVQLFVKRVHVMDDCDALMPEYLRFVKGVVDAQDVSLNVSREILQQDRRIHTMRRRLVKKVLATLQRLMDSRPDAYATFWTEFGRALKEGLVTDYDNWDTLLRVSSFASTHDAEHATTLRQYLERAGEDQKCIYYLTGANRAIVENSPHLEGLRARGIEVLILTDPIDEMWTDAIPAFNGVPFQSAAKGEPELPVAAADATSTEDDDVAQVPNCDAFLSWLTHTLRDQVCEVRTSTRLTNSAACLISGPDDLTPSLEKMYRAMGQQMLAVKRTLEINPEHPLVTALQAAHETRPQDPILGKTAELLHGMAQLAEGGELPDPARFTKLLGELLPECLQRAPTAP